MVNTGLKGKTVLVTGAQHGIGAATARAFAAQGACVFIHYFRLHGSSNSDIVSKIEFQEPGERLYRARQSTTADDVVREIRSRGGRAEVLEADLLQPESVPLLFDRAEQAFGPVQVVVNNAAHWEADTFLPPDSDPANPLVELWTTRPKPLTSDTMNCHFAVNVRAVALMMAEYLRRHRHHRLSWGRVINVSTDAAYCFPGEVSYGASKFALESFSRSAAYEMGKFGITVNVVAPGPTQTGWITSELEKEIIPAAPLGRLGQPEDVADVIVFFASEQARWLTGQLLYVGGGNKM